MKAFAALYHEIDSSTRTNEKLAAIKRYFSSASDRDSAWALFFLAGRTLQRSVNTTLLRTWISEYSQLPLWLVEECYDAVGDLAETLALLAPDQEQLASRSDLSLADLVETRLVPLRAMADDEKRAVLEQSWAEFNSNERLVWNKLITGSLRIGVSRTLVERALADLANTTQATMAHRLMGGWDITASGFRAVMSGDEIATIGQPYPFMLAYPLEGEPESLGSKDEWIAEWKWDGIRAQVIKRSDEILVWSRGEERVTDAMPEVYQVGAALPNGTVLDGEILAWAENEPMPFATLQRRLNRKVVGAKLLAEAPVAFIAYDILEFDGVDIRVWPLEKRKKLLETVVDDARLKTDRIFLSKELDASGWDELVAERRFSREHKTEGLMLKKKDAPYGVGRQRGLWWKWKIEPYSVDAVMVYAQAGHGRRASLFTDYTFAVWQDGVLLPIAKAYSGLSDSEIRDVDRFIRSHTLEKHGPVRVVEPAMVFELAFEGIQKSSRHKSGIAVRFPRIARIRTDKKPEDADTLDMVKALLNAEPVK